VRYRECPAASSMRRTRGRHAMSALGSASGSAPKRAVTCNSCGQQRVRMPTSWSLYDCGFYCQPCWQAFECRICGHKDPKGHDFKGSWNCRSCRHKRQVKEKTMPSHDRLQRLIIEDNEYGSGLAGAVPSADPREKQEEAVKLLDHLASINKEDQSDVSDDDTWADADVVGELPALGKASRPGRKPDTSKPRHVLLLLDASGSMRSQDVDVDAETRTELAEACSSLSRMEAAELCALKFVKGHAQVRPQDVFSAIAFHETATILLKRRAASEFVQMFGLADRAANGTFFLEGLKAAAACLGEADLPGELVLLSDGRPADIKAALHYFQDTFIRGKHAGVHVHGIGFGTTVESFAPLQQLACLSGGTFALSGSTVRGLCQAFSSVSSTITSSKSDWVMAEEGGSNHKPQLRIIEFELPEQGIFGKKHVLRFGASRTSFSFDGDSFHETSFAPEPVVRRQLPYMRGGMRLVFSFQDDRVSKEGSWMVAKSSRYVDATLNSRIAIEAHAKSSALASYFAARFNARLRAMTDDSGGSPATLFFVPCYLYEVQGVLSKNYEREPRCFAAERYLPGVFLKYNSNNGYVADAPLPHNEIVQAFLHYSFEESGGRFIVSDLQGVARQSEVLLTDPQVLSLTREFGPGDLGAVGYLPCLQSHRCGFACKRLGLHPVNSSKLRQMGRSQTDLASNSSWQQIPSESSFPDWDRVSERAASEYVLGRGNPNSKPVSESSWVHVLECGSQGSKL